MGDTHTIVTIRLETPDYKVIKEMAKREDRPMASLIRRLILEKIHSPK